MAKKLVEYKLERYPVTFYDGKNYKVEMVNTMPAFIEDGGYFSLNNKMVGITCCSSNSYIPQTLIELDAVTLKARCATIGLTKMVNDEPVAMTEQEISDYVDAWMIEKGL